MLTLVTGATGFLGCEVVRALRARGRPVRALVRTPERAGRLDGLEVEVVPGDTTDRASVDRALDGVARVFHVAGLVSYRRSDEERLRSANVTGAETVVDASRAAGVERVVFTSSVAAIGPAAGPGHPRDEGAWMIDGDDGRPDFRYHRTKAAAEQAALAAAAEGLDVVVVNPGFVIGPGDVNRASTWPIEEYLRGRLRFTVRGGLSYVDVRDVAAGMLAAEERGRAGERYILTDDAGNLSHADFFRLVGRVTGTRRRQVNAPVGLLHPLLRAGNALRLPVPLHPDELGPSARWWFFTAAKARAELGLETRPLEESVADTVAWLRADGYHRH